MRVRRTPNPPRRGVQAVEAAIVLPVVMMLILGTFSTAMGVYYYQLVATLAREGARWASVHGPTYQAEHPPPTPPTSQDVYNNAILPMAVGLTPAQLTCVLTMTSNTATVKVTYQWTPDFFITGPLNLTSTSVMPISY